jgi:hypothetical protein
MISNMDKGNEFLKNLIRKSEVSGLSDDFTRRVMIKITEKGQEYSSTVNILERLRYWYIPIILGIAGLAYSIYYFLHLNLNLRSGEFNPMILPVFKRMLLSFKEIIPTLKISSFTIIVLLSIACLVVADLLIARIKPRKNIFLEI